MLLAMWRMPMGQPAARRASVTCKNRSSWVLVMVYAPSKALAKWGENSLKGKAFLGVEFFQGLGILPGDAEAAHACIHRHVNPDGFSLRPTKIVLGIFPVRTK